MLATLVLSELVVFVSLVLDVVAQNASYLPGASWRVVAGTGSSGFGGNTFQHSVHDFAVEVRLNSPWGITLDIQDDRLYVADTLNNVIRSIDLVTGLTEVIAGTGDSGFSGDGGLAVLARMDMPTGLALDVTRRILYVSDMRNNRVRAITISNGRVYEAEGNAALQGPEARLTCPPVNISTDVTPLLLGSAFCDGSTGSGHVDFLNTIQDRMNFTVVAHAGAGAYELRFRYADRYGGGVRTGPSRLMRLYLNGRVLSHSVAFLPTGPVPAGRRNFFGWLVQTVNLRSGTNVITLEVTGQGGPRIDQLYVVPPRPMISTVAGNGVGDMADDLAAPRPALQSPLRTPLGLALDAAAQLLYIADADNGRVRRLSLGTGMIVTIAGGAVRSSTRDGEPALDGKLFRPTGLALDSSGEYLFISDSVQMTVRRLDLSARLITGGVLTTVAGVGLRQAPLNHLLWSPQGILFDLSRSELYVADRENAAVRKTLNISNATCPVYEAWDLLCGPEDAILERCEVLDCCFDPVCGAGYNPDGRASQSGFKPLDVMTDLDGKLRNPPITFVRPTADRCCHPKLRPLTSLQVLDSPQGLVLDPRNRALYVTQARRHMVARLFLDDPNCLISGGPC